MNGNLPAAKEESRQVDMQNSSKQLAQKKRRASEVSCRTLARLQKRNGDILGQCAGSKSVSTTDETRTTQQATYLALGLQSTH